MIKWSTLFATGAILVAAMQLTSCKKDEDKKAKTMTGNWTVTTMGLKETTNGVVTTDTFFSIAGLYSITFNDDKSYKRYTPLVPAASENGTYVTIGTKLILNYTEDGVAMSDTCDYEFSKDTFMMKETTTEVYDTETVVSESSTNFIRN